MMTRLIDELKSITSKANEDKSFTKMCIDTCKEAAKSGDNLAWILAEDVRYKTKRATINTLRLKGLQVDDLGRFLQIMW